MKTETQQKLEDFRREQKELFDNKGKSYTGRNFPHFAAERMLQLINSLESELVHASDCSLHNEPATPKGVCDCHLAIVISDEKRQSILKNVIHPLMVDDNGNRTHDGSEGHLVLDIQDILNSCPYNLKHTKG